jgi:arginyl-tRNA synthetase
VKLPSGKMSSRSGNVIGAEEILDEVKEKIREISPELDSISLQKLAVAAIKFAFLKYSTSSDIIYDVNESISLHGDTGPYVLYVYARIQSLLKKAEAGNRAKDSEADEDSEDDQNEKIAQKKIKFQGSLEKEERDVLRNLEYFEFITAKAADNFQPNELVKYLLGLCKAFNLFYESQTVIGSKNQEFRLELAAKTAETIKLGLYLLGIETVDKM